MEGISKEVLLAVRENLRASNRGGYANGALDLADDLLAECKELDPWLPIAGAPWNKPIKVFYPTMPDGLRQKIICRRVNWDASLHKPTHYKELSPGPKE